MDKIHPPTKNPFVHFFYEFEDVLWHNYAGFFITFFVLFLIFRLAVVSGSSFFIVLSIILLYGHIVIGMALMFKKTINALFNAKTLFRLLAAYILSAMLLIGFISPMYYMADLTNSGYLKYGTCTDKMSQDQMLQDIKNNVVSDNRIYFTSVTFFALGYGDICPMGVSKYIALFNVAVGVFFITAIMAIAISRFQKTTGTEEEPKEKAKNK